MNIKNLIKKLERKYKTRNAFELADALGIIVTFEELGSINGYYSKQFRIKQIHINCNLPEHLKLLTCAHELGHAVLHPNANSPFLRSSTFFSIERLEIEANKFAAELLISDELIEEYQHLTSEQLARILGYCKALIDYKIN